MFKKFYMFFPAMVLAGTIEYVDDRDLQQPRTQEDRQKIQTEEKIANVDKDNVPESKRKQHELFLYNQEKDYLKKTIVKKDRSYFEGFYARKANLNVSNLKFYYVPVGEEILATQNLGSSTIDSQGSAFYFSFAARKKYFAFGVQADYINHPTINFGPSTFGIVSPPNANQNQNQNNQNSGNTSGTTNTVVTPPSTTLTCQSIAVKTTSIPIHVTALFFPFNDYRIQPYAKVGLGANYISGNMKTTSLTSDTLVDVDEGGITMIPFTITYGAGLHVHLTPNLSLSLSYNAHRLVRGRGPKPNVKDKATGESYGQLRLYYDQTYTSSMNFGLCYYL